MYAVVSKRWERGGERRKQDDRGIDRVGKEEERRK